MNDPVPLDDRAQRLAAAKEAQANREKGIHANAVKQGRIAERTEILTQLGAQTLADASQAAQLRAERDARPTLNEERKHGRHRFWQGIAVGAAICAPLVALIILTMQSVIWDTAARSFREQAMTGAVLSGQQERTSQLPRQP